MGPLLDFAFEAGAETSVAVAVVVVATIIVVVVAALLFLRWCFR